MCLPDGVGGGVRTSRPCQDEDGGESAVSASFTCAGTERPFALLGASDEDAVVPLGAFQHAEALMAHLPGPERDVAPRTCVRGEDLKYAVDRYGCRCPSWPREEGQGTHCRAYRLGSRVRGLGARLGSQRSPPWLVVDTASKQAFWVVSRRHAETHDVMSICPLRLRRKPEVRSIAAREASRGRDAREAQARIWAGLVLAAATRITVCGWRTGSGARDAALRADQALRQIGALSSSAGELSLVEVPAACRPSRDGFGTGASPECVG